MMVAGAPRAVVVGGGYIGVEMAEALLRRGFRTTLITRSRVMSHFDDDMCGRIAAGLVAAGVDVRQDMTVSHLEVRDGRVSGVVTAAGDRIEADVVVPAVGIRPATELGRRAGLPLGTEALVRRGLDLLTKRAMATADSVARMGMRTNGPTPASPLPAASRPIMPIQQSTAA